MNAVSERFPKTPLVLSPALIEAAQARAASRPGMTAAEVMAEDANLDIVEVTRLIGDWVGLDCVELAEVENLVHDDELIPYVDAVTRLCGAFSQPDGETLVVFGDGFDARTRLWVESRIRTVRRDRLQWALISGPDLRALHARRSRDMRMIEPLSAAAGGGSTGHDSLDLSIGALRDDESPIVRIVNATLYDALNAQASDIHLETDATGLSIKYRIDGVLDQIGHVDGLDNASQMISRIKVLAELDIAERRIPQDGRLKVNAQGRDIDLRVSIMPNLRGEDAVLRILDRQALTGERQRLTIETLGFDGERAAFARGMAAMPYGLFLVTGPTGSGKTTTLYALLNEINSGLDKIITIEDPVEYELPGILQIPVNEAKGLTFSRGLRSILRHDPDKIMVGEIRDPDTAQIAIQAALTGHQVFATVHANNVFDVIGRLSTMGIDTYSLVSALNGLLAQRLVRLSCPNCATEYHPDAELLRVSGISRDEAAGMRFMHSKGCAHCRGTGFKGRRAIAETLKLGDEVRELIACKAPLGEIRQAARRAGLRTLRESAVDLVRLGQSTLEEINRVTIVGQ